MSLLDTAVGWLAPTTCVGCAGEGAALCEACQTAELLPYRNHCAICGAVSPNCRTCPTCRTSAPSHIWVATEYEGLAQELLQSYKFGHLRVAVRPLALSMAQTLCDYLSPEELSKKDYLIVPVPTATVRVRQRSFDHAKLLAQTVARNTGLRFYPALARLGQARQVGARRTTRLNQQSNSYALRPRWDVKGRNILLIDDVVTTCATLKATTKVLRAAGAKRVDALVFAKRI